MFYYLPTNRIVTRICPLEGVFGKQRKTKEGCWSADSFIASICFVTCTSTNLVGYRGAKGTKNKVTSINCWSTELTIIFIYLPSFLTRRVSNFIRVIVNFLFPERSIMLDADSSTNDSCSSATREALSLWETSLTIITLTLIIVVTIIGNVLVILSVFTYKPLRIVQNFFIVSLAVADLTVAILVLPFNIIYWILGRGLNYYHPYSKL